MLFAAEQKRVCFARGTVVCALCLARYGQTCVRVSVCVRVCMLCWAARNEWRLGQKVKDKQRLVMLVVGIVLLLLMRGDAERALAAAPSEVAVSNVFHTSCATAQSKRQIMIGRRASFWNKGARLVHQRHGVLRQAEDWLLLKGGRTHHTSRERNITYQAKTKHRETSTRKGIGIDARTNRPAWHLVC